MFNVITGAVDAIGDAARHAVAGMSGGSASFRVQPERVYTLANRFDEIANMIDGGIAREVMSLVVRPPGADRPSVDAAGRITETGFGDAGLISRLDGYVMELRNAARSLRQTGELYGLTDHTEGGRLSAADA